VYMKKVLLLFVSVLLICSSCKNKSSLIGKTDENQKLLTAYFKHFNNHNWNQMAKMYVPNPEFKDPSLGQGVVKQSRQQIVKKYTELAAIFPDVRDSIVNMYSSGDQHIIVEFISKGTAADKSKFELPICTIFTVENGLIAKDYTYYDNF
jgi:predicted SnoaL-like aldol condensation-catalyzing enzyme